VLEFVLIELRMRNSFFGKSVCIEEVIEKIRVVKIGVLRWLIIKFKLEVF